MQPNRPTERLVDRRADPRVYAARPELDDVLLPELRALPYFREATPSELERSYACYVRGDIEALLREWAEHAEPTRATMPTSLRLAYAHAGKGPRQLNASVFLDSLTASLRAGERFRARLSTEVREVVCSEFPYLEHRHEHVPDTDAPAFEFPRVFDEYIEWGSLDDTRARWQLAVAINEVQQSCYSDFAAGLFRLPELHRHAARERDLARNYFGHWSPRCSYELWRETIYVLDALNAATFEYVCTVLLPRAMAPSRMFSGSGRRARWREFVAKLDSPQWLLPIVDVGEGEPGGTRDR